MPHKIYMCCDSNTCTCGEWEKTFGGKPERKKSNLEEFSDEDLQNELEKRKEALKIKIWRSERIRELEEELKILKGEK